MSQISSSSSSTSTSTSTSCVEIPTEIISDEEMLLIEAAFSFAFQSTSNSSHFKRNITSSNNNINSSCSSYSCILGDIEDGLGFRSNQTQTQTRKNKDYDKSLLNRFRKKTGLSVTDITSTEWCEKQKEFFLLYGKPKASKAMKAGSARHAVLEQEIVRALGSILGLVLTAVEEEPNLVDKLLVKVNQSRRNLMGLCWAVVVITRVEVVIRSAEEHWALKMINFMHGINQLILDGLTRELPLIGFAEGVCVVGVIDEIQMTTIMGSNCVPTLVETKTRLQDNLPSESQQRNARLQLMCYKYLWDNLLSHPFPSEHFLNMFSLNPNYILSKEIQEFATQAGAPAQTLNDVLGKYKYVCSMLPETQDRLLLRYEYQKDQSLIGEIQYPYDCDWVTDQIKSSLEFWNGEREASYALEDERWKCKFCMYVSECPINIISTTQTAKQT